MAIVYSRVGNTLTVTITQDVTDIVAATGPTKDDKIITGLQRCDDQLRAAIAGQRGSGFIDVQITALTAQKAALPVPVPTF